MDIRPITEKVVSKVRMANYKSGRPFSALNAILGQQDSQMADKRRKKNPSSL